MPAVPNPNPPADPDPPPPVPPSPAEPMQLTPSKGSFPASTEVVDVDKAASSQAIKEVAAEERLDQREALSGSRLEIEQKRRPVKP